MSTTNEEIQPPANVDAPGIPKKGKRERTHCPIISRSRAVRPDADPWSKAVRVLRVAIQIQDTLGAMLTGSTTS
jgi:hypothetical protein